LLGSGEAFANAAEETHPTDLNSPWCKSPRRTETGEAPR
jgi:hypothetical protein